MHSFHWRGVAAILACTAISPVWSASPASATHGVTGVAWADRFVPTEGVPYDDPSELTITMGQGQIRLDEGLAAWSATDPFTDPVAGLPGPYGLYQAQGQAAQGLNRASARVDATSESGPGRWSAGAYGGAAWYEQITVMGGTGQGELVFQVDIDGNFEVWGPTNTEGLPALAGVGYNLLRSDQPFDFTTNPLLEQGLAFACEEGLPTGCDYDPVRLHSMGSYYIDVTQSGSVAHQLTAVVPFTYGEAFYVIGAMEVGVYAYQVGAGAQADFMHTARVGQVILPPGAVVTLGSGAYASYGLPAVPEPQTWAFAVAGLLVFAGRALRARRP